VRAAVCPSYGGPDVVEVSDIAAPPLGAGEVRVQVHVAAINFPDVLLVADTYQMSVPPPFVPGSEFAGVVIETAAGRLGHPYPVGS
jgi:NADPH2:quinone reductase